MSTMGGHGSGDRTGWRRRIAAVLAVEVLIVGGVIAAEIAARRAERGRMTYKLNPWSTWLENVAKPIQDPPIVEAARARIKPEAGVIGVEVDGRARAYLIGAMDDPGRHLVSDTLAGVPLTVSYCNISRCVQVYARPKGSGPLDIEVAGLLNQEMVIKVGGSLYYQSSGRPVEPEKDPSPIPCDVLTPVVTTWKAWTSLHPETDVYEGPGEQAGE